MERMRRACLMNPSCQTSSGETPWRPFWGGTRRREQPVSFHVYVELDFPHICLESQLRPIVCFPVAFVVRGCSAVSLPVRHTTRAQDGHLSVWHPSGTPKVSWHCSWKFPACSPCSFLSFFVRRLFFWKWNVPVICVVSWLRVGEVHKYLVYLFASFSF